MQSAQWLDLGIEDRENKVRFPANTDFSRLLNVQISSTVDPVFNSVTNRRSLPRGKSGLGVRLNSDPHLVPRWTSQATLFCRSMPQRRADEEIYFWAIRTNCITYLDRKERNNKMQQKCIQDASKFLLFTQHYTDNKVKKNGLMGHA
jgi:hypothetical protein